MTDHALGVDQKQVFDVVVSPAAQHKLAACGDALAHEEVAVLLQHPRALQQGGGKREDGGDGGRGHPRALQ